MTMPTPIATSATTLFDALAAMMDHRTQKGRRFSLPAVVMIALAAMLSGANDLMAIARWGRRLSPTALQGAVVTGDAARTFKPVVEAIRERGGSYFLFVKANQPELRAELARAFGDVSPRVGCHGGAAESQRAA